MPAGTGVCVVKTLLARAASSAFVEAEPGVAHEDAHLLERQKGRVAFVHVEDGGLEAQRLERAHAADAQHDLLPDARIVIAAVERIGDVAILRQTFSGMLVSSRYSVMRPTSSFQTWMETSPEGSLTVTLRSCPPASFTGMSGSV